MHPRGELVCASARARSGARPRPVRAHRLADPRRLRTGPNDRHRADARRLPRARHRIRPVSLRRRSGHSVAAAGWRAASRSVGSIGARDARRSALGRDLAWAGELQGPSANVVSRARAGARSTTCSRIVTEPCISLRSRRPVAAAGFARSATAGPSAQAKESLGTYVGQLYEDSRGHIWAVSGTGLWRWTPAPATRFSPSYDVGDSLQGLVESDDGDILIAATRAGVQRLVDGRFEAAVLPGSQAPPAVRRCCAVIVTAVSGSVLAATDFFMRATDASMLSRAPADSRATSSPRFSRIARATSGSSRPRAWTAFASLRPRRWAPIKACRVPLPRPC